jgi:hypothetical protein
VRRGGRRFFTGPPTIIFVFFAPEPVCAEQVAARRSRRLRAAAPRRPADAEGAGQVAQVGRGHV